MHGHRRNAQFLAGAQDAKRDLAAIGDQDFLEHGGFVDDGSALPSIERLEKGSGGEDGTSPRTRGEVGATLRTG
jgi:hypothetical protein